MYGNQEILVVTFEESFRKIIMFDPAKFLNPTTGIQYQPVVLENTLPAGKWASTIGLSKDLLILMHFKFQSRRKNEKNEFSLRLLRTQPDFEGDKVKDIPILQQSIEISRLTTKVHSVYLTTHSTYCAAFHVGKCLSLACWHVDVAKLEITRTGFSNFELISTKHFDRYHHDLVAVSDSVPTFLVSQNKIFCLWLKLLENYVYCLCNGRFHKIPLTRGFKATISQGSRLKFNIPMATNPSGCSLYYASPCAVQDSQAPRVFEIYRLLLKW